MYWKSYVLLFRWHNFINEKSHENILLYDIWNKTLIDSKPLPIRFFKIDGIIRIYDRTKYLTLLGSEKYELFTAELDNL